MAQATVSIRMDAELKNQMEKLCDELGMNLTTAFTIFAKKATRERRIPFEVSVSGGSEPVHRRGPDSALRLRALPDPGGNGRGGGRRRAAAPRRGHDPCRRVQDAGPDAPIRDM